MTGRYAVHIPGVAVHQIHLIKRIPRLSFRLKNHQAPIGGEVTLPGPFARQRHLRDIGQ